MPWKRIPLAERFWKRVDKHGPIVLTGLGRCWGWTGATDGTGYGMIKVFKDEDDRMVMAKAHRVSWMISIGRIPPELLVLHRCDNRRCVNPEHLFLGTHKDNVADMHRKNRGSYGEKHWKHKLNADQVREIRRRFSSGETARGIARSFGVDRTTIKAIVDGSCWNRLPQK